MEEKSKIAAILNKYKNTFDDLIDSLNTEFLDPPNFLKQPKIIDKRSRNALRSKNNLTTLSEKDYLDKNILVMSLELMLKI